MLSDKFGDVSALAIVDFMRHTLGFCNCVVVNGGESVDVLGGEGIERIGLRVHCAKYIEIKL